MSGDDKQPLYFTFGNHMHWVGMQWLWGYGALPGSVRDMLHLCRETGARGNVNFDAVGYEKLSIEDPEAFAELRAAVRDGRIEIVGASYAQPYGGFHGAESNVRQRVYGVRTVQRLFGVRPRAFWEEEFDFFPQLPQLLVGCGHRAACLFFQWTWHTPHVPLERAPLIQWEGLDGTRIKTLPRTELCLHQWPEDFDGRIEPEALRAIDRPAIVQWLELLPSPDWMCRSELMLPRLRELFGDPRFDVRPRTLSELVEELEDGDAPVRRYTPDQVFHGMTLGKNGDLVPRLSREAERTLLAAEAAAAIAGLLGRPYPHWDVYPTWELEEAWRDLLVSQHHDNHESEGLVGAIGKLSSRRAMDLADEVLGRTLEHLARRAQSPGSAVVFNPLGWTRDVLVSGPTPGIVRDVPAFGFRVFDAPDEALPAATMVEIGDTLTLARDGFNAVLDTEWGCVRSLRTEAWPDGMIDAKWPVGLVSWTGVDALDQPTGFEIVEEEDGLRFVWTLDEPEDDEELDDDEPLIEVGVRLHPLYPALELSFVATDLPRPKPGYAGAYRTRIAPGFAARIIADHPFGMGEVDPRESFVRKYPSGEWMTSEQWFEQVERPIHALHFIDLRDRENVDRNLLVVHDGSQAFFATDGGLDCVLSAYDPWDEEEWDGILDARLWILPHSNRPDSWVWRVAQELESEGSAPAATSEDPPSLALASSFLPRRFAPIEIDAKGVAATTLHRESAHAAAGFPDAFGAGVRDAFVLRLVELDGKAARVRLRVPGPVARAARTNLLGEVIAELEGRPVAGSDPAVPFESVEIRLELRPYEIATVMLDLVPGRQVPRNLDEHRGVWSSVHRRAGTD